MVVPMPKVDLTIRTKTIVATSGLMLFVVVLATSLIAVVLRSQGQAEV